MDAKRFRWNGRELYDVSDSPQLPLLVASSFLLREGFMVGKKDHEKRFSHSASSQGLINPVTEFLEAVWAFLPHKGILFPRVDVTDRGELEVIIRPAPPLAETLVLATTQEDPRTVPAIKGPDIPVLGTLREKALSLGADEAILTCEGKIVDGATTALVWVMDDDIYQLPMSQPRVESITVKQLPYMTGQKLKEQAVAPQQLESCEVYALNALHGVRAVTKWIDGPQLTVNKDRLNDWRRKYDLLFERVNENT